MVLVLRESRELRSVHSVTVCNFAIVRIAAERKHLESDSQSEFRAGHPSTTAAPRAGLEACLKPTC